MNLEVLETLELKEGSHDSIAAGACLLEAVSFVAGERWSDHPKCASELLGSFGRSLNDNLPHDLRQELKPLIPMLVGSVGDAETEERRSVMLSDWYIREHFPRVLRHAELGEEADKLAALPPLTREKNTEAAIEAVRVAGAAARDARAAWAARAARDATFDLCAQARAKQQGLELSAQTIQGIMTPVVEDLWRDQIALFRRLIEAGPHGDAA